MERRTRKVLAELEKLVRADRSSAMLGHIVILGIDVDVDDVDDTYSSV